MFILVTLTYIQFSLRVVFSQISDSTQVHGALLPVYVIGLEAVPAVTPRSTPVGTPALRAPREHVGARIPTRMPARWGRSEARVSGRLQPRARPNPHLHSRGHALHARARCLVNSYRWMSCKTSWEEWKALLRKRVSKPLISERGQDVTLGPATQLARISSYSASCRTSGILLSQSPSSSDMNIATAVGGQGETLLPADISLSRESGGSSLPH